MDGTQLKFFDGGNWQTVPSAGEVQSSREDIANVWRSIDSNLCHPNGLTNSRSVIEMWDMLNDDVEVVWAGRK